MGPKKPDLDIFSSEFSKPIAIFEISIFKLVKLQDYTKKKNF